VGGLAIAPRGRLLYATAPAEAEQRPLREVPPWFTAFFLDAPGEGAREDRAR
jgi:hypothetical protein